MERESTFLLADEIQQITLYSRSAEQCKELDRLGLQYMRNRHGKPLVLRKALDEFFHLKTATREPIINLDALNELQHG